MPPSHPPGRPLSLSPSASRPAHLRPHPSSSSPTAHLPRSQSDRPPASIDERDSVDHYHVHFVEPLFQTALHIVQTRLPRSGPIQPTYNDKLLLYSLFKQAIKGDARTAMARPGVFDMLGRAKWDAWKKREGLSVVDAKKLYVESLLQILRLHKDVPESRVLIETLRTFRPSSSTDADLSDSDSALESRSRSGSRPASSLASGSAHVPAVLGPYVTPAQLPDPVLLRRSPSPSVSASADATSRPSSEHESEPEHDPSEPSHRGRSLSRTISETHSARRLDHSPGARLRSQLEAVEANVESLKSIVAALAERVDKQESLLPPLKQSSGKQWTAQVSAWPRELFVVFINLFSSPSWRSVLWTRFTNLILAGGGKIRWWRLVLDGFVGVGVVWILRVMGRERRRRRMLRDRGR